MERPAAHRCRAAALAGAIVVASGLTGLAGQTTAPAPPTGVRIIGGAPSPAPPPPPPPASVPRLYAADSPWNTPIPANAAVDVNSAAMAQAVAAAAQSGGFLIAVKRWSWPIYFADAATPKVTVGLTAYWAPAKSMAGVPIPSNARPDPGGDGHMAIVDTSTQCEYDFWQAAQASSGTWTASWANVTSSAGPGWFAGGYSATGSGAAGAAGVIRPEELQAGVIAHALGFSFPHTKAGGPVLPATESDGRSTASYAIPEGARLQLNPALDLSTLGLNAYELIIGRALQQYGMYLMDSNSGGVSLVAQNPQSTSVPYPWTDQAYVYLPVSLLSSLRVLQLGPQYTQTGYLNAGGCATFQ